MADENFTAGRLAQEMLQRLDRTVPVKLDKEDSDRFDRIVTLLKQLDEHLKKFDEVPKHLREMVDTLKKLRSEEGKAAAKAAHVGEKKPTPTATDIAAKAKPATGTSSKSPTATDIVSQSVAPPSKPPGPVSQYGSGGGRGGRGGDALAEASRANAASFAMQSGLMGVVKLLNDLNNATGIHLSDIFAGAIKDELAFTMGMRKIITETRAWDQSLQDAEKTFFDIGNTSVQTGFSVSVFQQEWMKNARKGYTTELQFVSNIDKQSKKVVTTEQLRTRTQADQVKLLKNTLSTAFAIGTSASDTASIFDHWQKTFGMTNNELFAIGSSLIQIARDTGVSGDNLMQAAKSAEEIMRNLAGHGLTSANSVAQAIEQAVLAAKYGIEGVVKDINISTASLWDWMTKLKDPHTAMILGNMFSKHPELWEKMVTYQMPEHTVERDKAVAESLQDILKGRLKDDLGEGAFQQGGLFEHGFDLKTLRMEIQRLMDLQKTVAKGSDKWWEIKTALDTLTTPQKILGEKWDVLTLENFGKFTSELKTTAERVSEMQKKLADPKILNEQRKAIQESLGKITDTARTQIISSFSDKVRSGRPDFVAGAGAAATKQAEQAGLGKLSIQDVAGQSVDYTRKQLKDLKVEDKGETELHAAGYRDFASLSRDLASTNKEAQKRAMDAFQSIQNVITKAQSIQNNPQMQAAQTLLEINDWLRKESRHVIMAATRDAFLAIAAAGIGANVLLGLLGVARLKNIYDKVAGGGRAAAAASRAVPAAEAGYAITSKVMPTASKSTALVPYNPAASKSTALVLYNPAAAKGASAAEGMLTLEAKSYPVGEEVIKQGTRFGRMFEWLAEKLGPVGRFFGRIGRVLEPVVVLFGELASAIGRLLAPIGRLIAKIIPWATGANLFKFAAKGGFLAKLGMQGGKAALGMSTLGIATAVFAVIEGAIGAWGGYTRTAENFAGALKKADGTMKDVTVGMKIASTYGGFMAGVLDSLTFGILGFLGIKGPLEKLFAWLAYTIINPIENFIEGFKEGFMNAWETVKPALAEAWAAFKQIGESFDDLFKGIGEIFGWETTGVIDTFKKIWDAVGPIFKQIGFVVGHMLADAFKMLVPIIKFVAEVIMDAVNIIKGAIQVISGVIGVIWNTTALLIGWISGNDEMMAKAYNALKVSLGSIVKGLGNIIWGVVKGLFDVFIGSIWTALSAIVAPIADIFTPVYNTIKGIKDWFYKLYMWLVGGSLIPDLVNGIIEWFAKLPLMILTGLGKLGLKIVSAGLGKLGLKIVSAVGDVIVNKLPMMLLDALKSVCSGLLDWFKGTVGKAKEGFSAGYAGDKKAMDKAGWGTARGVGQVAGGVGDVVTGGGEGRWAGAKRAAWGAGETALGLGGNLIGRGWLWGKGDSSKIADNKSATENIQDSLDTTAKTMEMGATKGSIYVHDIHCEAVLGRIYERIVGDGSGKRLPRQPVTPLDTGAFARGEGAAATDASMGQMIARQALMFSSAYLPFAIANKAVQSSANNTGAFAKENVVTAMTADDYNTKIASFAGRDLNNVQSSSKMPARGVGGLAKSMYFDDDEMRDLDGHLSTALDGRGQVRQASVSTNMFTPEDAEDYVYQQLRGSVPQHADMTGSVDGMLDWVKNQQYKKLCEIADELRKLQSGADMPTARSSKMPNAMLEEKEDPMLSMFDKDMLRGTWPGMQYAAYSYEHNATADLLSA